MAPIEPIPVFTQTPWTLLRRQAAQPVLGRARFARCLRIGSITPRAKYLLRSLYFPCRTVDPYLEVRAQQPLLLLLSFPQFFITQSIPVSLTWNRPRSNAVMLITLIRLLMRLVGLCPDIADRLQRWIQGDAQYFNARDLGFGFAYAEQCPQQA